LDLKIAPKNNCAAFSLVELLLTLVLILCLAAASVFSYTAMRRSASLDEGANRLQSLIRFAQAEAATTGRKVRLQFETGARPVTESGSDSVELRQIKVTWESDFINAPGVFEVYTNKAWSEDMVNELVGVEKVQPLQSSPTIIPPAANTLETGVTSTNSSDEFLAEQQEAPVDSFPAITFYPDGSCDSAEIVLASKNDEDSRRLAVRLSGILGSITSHPVQQESIDDFEEWDSADESSSPESASSSVAGPNFAQAE
jgi:Tfp pilus assembly protein FimT